MSKTLTLNPENEYKVFKSALQNLLDSTKQEGAHAPESMIKDFNETSQIVTAVLGGDPSNVEDVKAGLSAINTALYLISKDSEERVAFFKDFVEKLEGSLSATTDSAED